MSLVTDEVNDILEGAGWATDGYIMNHSDLKKSDRHKVMIKLANLGVLYDEDKLGEYNSEIEPTVGKMTSYLVKKKYKL